MLEGVDNSIEIHWAQRENWLEYQREHTFHRFKLLITVGLWQSVLENIEDIECQLIETLQWGRWIKYNAS